MAAIKDILGAPPELGLILEADYSQLEVIIQAQLAGPGQLQDDILSGKDIHSLLLAERMPESYEEIVERVEAGDKDMTHKRKMNKRMSFQLQYGAGYQSMAYKLGLPTSETREFIKSYYGRYPEVKEWQKKTIKSVEDSAVPSGRTSPTGYPIKVGTHQSQTGRIYTFFETDTPDEMRSFAGRVGFNPPNIKNYPVQGLATGDLVPIALALLLDKVLYEDLQGRKILVPFNTVHDSIAAYTAPEAYEDGAKIMQETMLSAADVLLTDFGIELFAPLRVEVEVGETLNDMRRII